MNQKARRTPEQWQSLVDHWKRSGQSMAHFCEEQGIGYASFCDWRKRLTDEGGATGSAVSFIDLGTLPSSSAERGWNIVLCLGKGVELRLSQP